MPPKSKKTVTPSPTPTSNDVNTNATYLIIVESPSKCIKIESYLGQNYRCIASKGHIRELDGLKNIDVKNDYKPTFTIIKEKAEHVSKMRQVIQQFPKENVILAADDDREGEAIAWHICDVFGLPIKTTKRIVFHEITQKAILEAVKTPTLLNMNLVHAQHARQILDILVGFKVSPHLWKHVRGGKKNALSAGRCQTPALRLIYDNEQARISAGAEKRYKTTGYFTTQDIEFHLGHEFEKEDEVETFLETSKSYTHILTMEPEKNVKKGAPKPFNTSRLLQAASNQLHTSPKQTMQLCQTLYQNGLITYMRTDSMKYAPPFLDTARKFIVQEYGGEEYIGYLETLETKDKETPHEAIRVTDIRLRDIPTEGEGREGAMYRLIWRNTVESCMSDAQYKATTAIITAPEVQEGGHQNTKKVHYSHTVEIPYFLGWKKVAFKPTDQGELVGRKMFFQGLSGGGAPYSRIDSKVVVRNKVSHYTEASLIQKLEELGIGRPSTFASLIETVQDRGYVRCGDVVGIPEKCVEFVLRRGEILDKRILEKTFGEEKNKLVVEPVGVLCLEFLLQHFEHLFDYNYTKQMEEGLDKIATFPGKEEDNPWFHICDECNREIAGLAKPVSKMDKEKYALEAGHEVVFAQFGPSIKKTNDQGETVFLPVKKGVKIDLDKLRAGEYNLGDLLAFENECLGQYNGVPLKLKTGKFGAYLEWGEERQTIREWEIPLNEITETSAVEYLDKVCNEPKKESGVLRVLGGNMSIRTGKFGPYVFYKTDVMKKPKFIPLKKCPHEYDTCDANILIEWAKEEGTKVKQYVPRYVTQSHK
jgi:DNA topoisomerase-1